MRAAVRFLVLVCCLAAFAVVGGGHWAVLQTVAWAQMVVSYAQDSGSMREGLVRTFDGAHPCELCRKISAGVQKESREERESSSGRVLLVKAKLTAVLPGVTFVPMVRRGVALAVMVETRSGRAADAPPTPPPRVA